MELNSENLSGLIDIDGADGIFTFENIESACNTAQKLACRSVTVSPCYVNTCAKFLANTPEIIKKSLIGAPYGSDMTSVKVYAAKQAEIIGAQIIEAEMNIGAFLSGNTKYVKHELETLAGNLEVIFSAAIDADSMDVDQAAQAADLAASVTPFVKIRGTIDGTDCLFQKIDKAYELCKGCIQITAAVKGAGLDDIEKLKDIGVEYFALSAADAEKLIGEAEAKPQDPV